jgi:hypothetical protein
MLKIKYQSILSKTAKTACFPCVRLEALVIGLSDY